MSAVVEHVQLPSRHSVRLLLENLVERDITIADGTPAPAKTTNVIGLYVTARLATAAIAVLDLEGAARLAGAIGGLGRVVVEESIGQRQLSPALRTATERALTELGTFGGGQLSIVVS